LQPKNSDLDTLKVIAHKQSGVWSSAVKAPAISLGQPANPTVPLAVLQGTDKL